MRLKYVYVSIVFILQMCVYVTEHEICLFKHKNMYTD